MTDYSINLGDKMDPQKTITIPDQSGKVAVVTGANSGIGFGVTRRLAAAGAEVILAVRNPAKGAQACEEIKREFPHAKLSVEIMDLANLEAIRAFTARLNSSGRPIHILVNNAGVMAPPTRHVTQ